MITKGTNQINKIALGANEIGRIYLGNGIVYGGEGESGGLLPTGYTAYDYLQADTSAYINTGVIGNTPLSMYLRFAMWVENPGDIIIVGARSSSGNTRVFPAASYQKRINYGYGVYVSATDESFGTSFVNGYHIQVKTSLAAGNQTREVYVEESDYTTTFSGTLMGDITTNLPLYLFRNNYASASHCPSSMRVYELKLYSDALFQNLVFHGIPAADSENVAGLYDIVGKQFLTNAGSGTLSVGNDNS